LVTFWLSFRLNECLAARGVLEEDLSNINHFSKKHWDIVATWAKKVNFSLVSVQTCGVHRNTTWYRAPNSAKRSWKVREAKTRRKRRLPINSSKIIVASLAVNDVTFLFFVAEQQNCSDSMPWMLSTKPSKACPQTC
jgi:hypothetical protein